MATLPAPPRLHPLLSGFNASWATIALIAAINTGIAGVLWIDDPRPFWQPFVTVQIYGFAIAYCVNVAQPWEKGSPIIRLACAAAVGAAIGVVMVVLVKGYTLAYVEERASFFAFNGFAAFGNEIGRASCRERV